MPRLASLLGSMAMGAALFAPPGFVGEFGLTSAAAAPAKAARKKAPARKSVKAAPAAAAAQPAGASRRVRFVEKKKAFAVKARYASLPTFKPKVVLKPAPAAPHPAEAAVKPPEVPPAAAAVPSAAPAKAELPPDRVMATASIMPVPVVHPGAERMRSALEARARSLASEHGLAAMPLPEAAPLPELTARRVTFDLEKGERTVVFEDGASVTAPFDKGRASDLTGLRPASR